jgi:hypothetical protein
MSIYLACVLTNQPSIEEREKFALRIALAGGQSSFVNEFDETVSLPQGSWRFGLVGSNDDVFAIMQRVANQSGMQNSLIFVGDFSACKFGMAQQETGDESAA